MLRRLKIVYADLVVYPMFCHVLCSLKTCVSFCNKSIESILTATVLSCNSLGIYAFGLNYIFLDSYPYSKKLANGKSFYLQLQDISSFPVYKSKYFGQKPLVFPPPFFENTLIYSLFSVTKNGQNR